MSYQIAVHVHNVINHTTDSNKAQQRSGTAGELLIARQETTENPNSPTDSQEAHGKQEHRIISAKQSQNRCYPRNNLRNNRTDSC